MKPVSDYPHFPDCPNVKTGVPRENYVEWRVNTQADGGGFINVCCEAEAQRLMRHARRWPNGSLRRTIERREVGPWMRMPTGGEVKRLTIESDAAFIAAVSPDRILLTTDGLTPTTEETRP